MNNIITALNDELYYQEVDFDCAFPFDVFSEATIQESDYIRPKWVTKLPACLTIQTGTKLDLACQATGAPMPGFKW